MTDSMNWNQNSEAGPWRKFIELAKRALARVTPRRWFTPAVAEIESAA